MAAILFIWYFCWVGLSRKYIIAIFGYRSFIFMFSPVPTFVILVNLMTYYFSSHQVLRQPPLVRSAPGGHHPAPPVHHPAPPAHHPAPPAHHPAPPAHPPTVPVHHAPQQGGPPIHHPPPGPPLQPHSLPPGAPRAMPPGVHQMPPGAHQMPPGAHPLPPGMHHGPVRNVRAVPSAYRRS